MGCVVGAAIVTFAALNGEQARRLNGSGVFEVGVVRVGVAVEGEEDLELRAGGFSVAGEGVRSDDSAVEFDEAADDGEAEADAFGSVFEGSRVVVEDV